MPKPFIVDNIKLPELRSNDQDYSSFFRLVIVGDSGVGKSNLILRYADNTFSECFISTIGVDFKVKNLQIENEVVKTQVWDTVGQDNFHLLYKYLKGKWGSSDPGFSAILLAFDLTNYDSFANVKLRLQEIESLVRSKTKIILVGTKADLISNRKVNEEDISEFVENHERIEGYIETSARTTQNVDAAFYMAARAILDLSMEPLIKGNKPLIKGNKLDSSKKLELIDSLGQYITRIESHKDRYTDHADFSYGFYFFSQSRAINREANYFFAKTLRDELQNTEKTIVEIFSGLTQKRNKVIGQYNLQNRASFTERGINSKELNAILNSASDYIKNLPQDNASSHSSASHI